MFWFWLLITAVTFFLLGVAATLWLLATSDMHQWEEMEERSRKSS